MLNFFERRGQPAVDATLPDDARRRVHRRTTVVVAYAMIVLGIPSAAIASFVFTMASAACTSQDETALICQTNGQLLVLVLPPVALLVGFVLCLRGVAMARKGERPLVWTVSGCAVYVLALVVDAAIATAV